MYLVRPYALVIPNPAGVSSVIGTAALPYTVAEEENTMERQ